MQWAEQGSLAASLRNSVLCATGRKPLFLDSADYRSLIMTLDAVELPHS